MVTGHVIRSSLRYDGNGLVSAKYRSREGGNERVTYLEGRRKTIRMRFPGSKGVGGSRGSKCSLASRNYPNYAFSTPTRSGSRG